MNFQKNEVRNVLTPTSAQLILTEKSINIHTGEDTREMNLFKPRMIAFEIETAAESKDIGHEDFLFWEAKEIID